MKDIQKINNMATDPIKNVLAGSVVQVIEEKQIKLFMSTIIPKVTDVDGVDVTSKEILFNREYFKGRAIVTDQRPETVPTVVMDSERVSVPMKWVSTGLRITLDDKDKFAKGITKFENKARAAMRTIAEEEENFLKNGIVELGTIGLQTIPGMKIVPTADLWKNLTGEEILEELRISWNAHTVDGLFEALALWLDKDLFDLLQKPYSATEPKTILNLLVERNWYGKIISIPRFGSGMIAEDLPSNFGYHEDLPLGMHVEYKEGTTDVYMLQEHISSIMVFQPSSLTRIEGAL